jgi:hypothetical protein
MGVSTFLLARRTTTLLIGAKPVCEVQGRFGATTHRFNASGSRATSWRRHEARWPAPGGGISILISL